MIKNHLKRIATPKTWNIHRKEEVFITRPNPGAHRLTHATSINTLFKELLGLATTKKEVKRILHEQEVFVDGTRRHDERFNVGYLDVVYLPKTKKTYRVGFSEKGKLVAYEVTDKEKDIKLVRINGKSTLKGNKQQLRCNDGRAISVAKDTYKVGDSLLIGVPKQDIKEHYALEAGKTAIIYKGKYAGNEGTIDHLEGNAAVLKTKEGLVHTKKSYTFVVGDKKPSIKCSP